ncbi:MAG: bcgIB [Gammaproteobacteria bacterium]|jgi:hypothetical protein|nr:bcgIB [Gammaproteobacteria bacterium]
MKLIPLKSLFDIKPGIKVRFNKLTPSQQGINFVSAGCRNNGVSATIKPIQGIAPHPAGALSVAVGGSVLETFLQTTPFYCSEHVQALLPKKRLSDSEKLVYCTFIRANQYRYSYGRPANKTLSKLLLPHPDDVRRMARKIKILKPFSCHSASHQKIGLTERQWKWFFLRDFFTMQRGRRIPNQTYKAGKIPYVSASRINNGIMQWIDKKPIFPKNSLSIGDVGCAAFYQPQSFCATSDVTVLSPVFSFNLYIGLFITTLLNQERAKWFYSRRIKLKKCVRLKIKLPVDNKDNPDWQFMEKYIKSLPYSSNLKQREIEN